MTISDIKKLTTPFTDEKIEPLRAGDQIMLSGVIYAARDAAHERLARMMERGEPMPFDFSGTAVYYAGPSPARPGRPVGSIGPTTAGRMDAYSPMMIERGLRVMIGKGRRSAAVRDAIVRHKGLYLAAIGGAAALIARSVKSYDVIAFEDLGPEAIARIEVEDFPLFVAIDCEGGDIYERH